MILPLGFTLTRPLRGKEMGGGAAAQFGEIKTGMGEWLDLETTCSGRDSF